MSYKRCFFVCISRQIRNSDSANPLGGTSSICESGGGLKWNSAHNRHVWPKSEMTLSTMDIAISPNKHSEAALGSQGHHNPHGTEWPAFLREAMPRPGRPPVPGRKPWRPRFLCVQNSFPLCVFLGHFALLNSVRYHFYLSLALVFCSDCSSIQHGFWSLTPVSSASIAPWSLDIYSASLTGVHTWHLFALRPSPVSFLFLPSWSNCLPSGSYCLTYCPFFFCHILKFFTLWW